MAVIAREASVATGSVYLHFASKATLFGEVFRRAAVRELDAVRHAGPEAREAPARLSAMLGTFARRALCSGRLAWALLAEPVDPLVDAERLVFREAYRDALLAVLKEGVAAGELELEVADLETTAAALVGATAEALVGPLSPIAATDEDSERLVRQVVAVSLRIAGACSGPTAEARK